MKNQRGVTLIALVVTIIVLIILAGVAIAALTGNNGLITRARESKKLQIEGEVRDRVTLAIAAAKVIAEREATKSNNGFSAATNIAENDSVIIDEIEKDLTKDANGNGFTITGTSGNIKIHYESKDYDQATNDSNAYIEVNVTVVRNTFTIPAGSDTTAWHYTDIVK